MSRWHLWGPLAGLAAFAALLAFLEEQTARNRITPPPFAAVAEDARISRFNADGATHRIAAPQVRAARDGGVFLDEPTLQAKSATREIQSTAKRGEIPRGGEAIIFSGDIRYEQSAPAITMHAATLRYRFADGETEAVGGVIFSGEDGEIRAPMLVWRPGQAAEFTGGVNARIRRQ